MRNFARMNAVSGSGRLGVFFLADFRLFALQDAADVFMVADPDQDRQEDRKLCDLVGRQVPGDDR